MNLIPTQTITRTPAQTIAEAMIDIFNAELTRRIETHSRKYLAFWESAATPDDILAAMGPAAGIVLAAASENVDHIGRLAAIVGKTVDDFLSPEFWVPRRAFIEHEDGTVTLEPPAEGFDAWGKPISQALENGAAEEITEDQYTAATQTMPTTIQ